MDPVPWLMVVALTLFLVEGFTLSVFPVQFQELLKQLEPRTLQAIGLVETVLAVGLMSGILLSR